MASTGSTLSTSSTPTFSTCGSVLPKIPQLSVHGVSHPYCLCHLLRVSQKGRNGGGEECGIPLVHRIGAAGILGLDGTRWFRAQELSSLKDGEQAEVRRLSRETKRNSCRNRRCKRQVRLGEDVACHSDQRSSRPEALGR